MMTIQEPQFPGGNQTNATPNNGEFGEVKRIGITEKE